MRVAGFWIPGQVVVEGERFFPQEVCFQADAVEESCDGCDLHGSQNAVLGVRFGGRAVPEGQSLGLSGGAVDGVGRMANVGDAAVEPTCLGDGPRDTNPRNLRKPWLGRAQDLERPVDAPDREAKRVEGKIHLKRCIVSFIRQQPVRQKKQ